MGPQSSNSSSPISGTTGRSLRKNDSADVFVSDAEARSSSGSNSFSKRNVSVASTGADRQNSADGSSKPATTSWDNEQNSSNSLRSLNGAGPTNQKQSDVSISDRELLDVPKGSSRGSFQSNSLRSVANSDVSVPQTKSQSALNLIPPANNPNQSDQIGPGRSRKTNSPARQIAQAKLEGGLTTPATLPASVSKPPLQEGGNPNVSALSRPQIIYRPGVPTVDDHGRMILRPDVIVPNDARLSQSYPSDSLPTLSSAPLKTMALPSAEISPVSGSVPATESVRAEPTRTVKAWPEPSSRPLPLDRATQSVYRTAQAPMDKPNLAPSELPPPQPPVEKISPGASSNDYDPFISTDGSAGRENGAASNAYPGSAYQGNAYQSNPYQGNAYPSDGYQNNGYQNCDDVACSDPVQDPCLTQIGSADGPIGRAWNGIVDCLQGPPCCNEGLGAERVMFAPFFIDTTQPLQNCRVRFDFAQDEKFPDRLEYFWARTPGGFGPPPPTSPSNAGPQSESVNYQDIRFYLERGTPKFSVATEIPIRMIDPELRDDTAGLGDMNLTTKTVILDGRQWQLAQIFRTYLPTGSPRLGTGDGHVSLEPGVAWRYKFSDVTYFHGDLKYWFPLGGNPDYAGQFLNYGFGISHVAYDGDRFAVIPTFEVIMWSLFDGQQTPPVDFSQPIPPLPTPMNVDNMTIVNLAPGVRFACENGNDCGTREIGISSGFAVSGNQWYSELLRVELRWSF